jgi:hypothetical protein
VNYAALYTEIVEVWLPRPYATVIRILFTQRWGCGSNDESISQLVTPASQHNILSSDPYLQQALVWSDVHTLHLTSVKGQIYYTAIANRRNKIHWHDLKVSRRLNARKSSRETSCVNMENQTDVSETFSVSIIRQWTKRRGRVVKHSCFAFGRSRVQISA